MTPRATYRLQLAPGFGFREAAAVVPYLAELGISHLYLSPVLQAAEGSTHGYDVVDPSRVSVDLGGEEAFRALVATARAAGLAILLDIVPNHMSIDLRTSGAARPAFAGLASGAGNAWWLDVLENGPASYYAAFFDVDWSSTSDDRVLLPILGERYGRALANGNLSIEWSSAPVTADAAYPTTFWVRAGDHRVPVSPRSVGTIVRRAGERIEHAELAYVGEALAALPSAHERSSPARLRRHRHRGVLLQRLDELARASSVRDAIETELAALNRDPVALDAMLEAQNYRLAHWSVAGSQLSYRRFFDVTSLVGVRVEDPDVFIASHTRILDWLHDGTIDGVRVDHVDGLRDPEAYLARLRDAAGEHAWIVVEKILAPHEDLPPTWPVDGTTGYDFLDLVGRLLVDPAGEATLTRTFTAYTGHDWDPAAARRLARREVMTDALHSELARLTELAFRACAASPACRDYTRVEIEDALAEILAHYPVYRTYLGTPRTVETTVRVARVANDVASARTPSKSKLEAFVESRRATEKLAAIEALAEHPRAESPPADGTRTEEKTAPMRPWREDTPTTPLAVVASPAEGSAIEPRADLFGPVPEVEARRSRDRMRVVDLVSDLGRATGTPPDGVLAIPRAHTRDASVGNARSSDAMAAAAPPLRTDPIVARRAQTEEGLDDHASAVAPRARARSENSSGIDPQTHTRSGDPIALIPRARTGDIPVVETSHASRELDTRDGSSSEPTTRDGASSDHRARTTNGAPSDQRARTTNGASSDHRAPTSNGAPSDQRARTTNGASSDIAPIASRTQTGSASPVEIDRARIAEAAAGARRARPDLDLDLLAFLESALAFELTSPEAQELARVAQQSTGPIVAKGDEDTLSYRAVRLLARSEVGADIAQLAASPSDVHARLERRGPRDMNATSTHDTKRGEDVRARLAVLSEIPAVWEAAVSSWGERAAAGWGDVERDRTFELSMWQTLVGAWPVSVERAQRYAEKATREARMRTSWRRPDERYEAARRAWIERVFGDRALLDEIEQLVGRIAPHGDRNSLAMLLVKLCAPGVPDFYQGSELGVGTLVDPDNRERYAPRDPETELDRAKLDVTRRVLALRRRAPMVFDGAYRAVDAQGLHADRVFAFARGDDLLVVVPRLGVGAARWPETTLVLDGTWVDVLSDRSFASGAHPLAEIWSQRPIALLLRSGT